MRIYFLITNVDPLIVYVYKEGLARFASHKFVIPNETNQKDLKIHLTNFAINSEAGHQIMTLENGMKNKWKLSDLFAYLEGKPELFDPNVTVTADSLFREVAETGRKLFTAVHPDLM